jgi:hypothetical protein
MGWMILAGCILAIVFGPAILAFLAPLTMRLPVLLFVFGGLQMTVGVVLYLMIYAGGVNWPWLLLIAALGMYYVQRGAQIRRLRAQSSDEAQPQVQTEKVSGENRVEPGRDAHRVT